MAADFSSPPCDFWWLFCKLHNFSFGLTAGLCFMSQRIPYACRILWQEVIFISWCENMLQRDWGISPGRELKTTLIAFLGATLKDKYSLWRWQLSALHYKTWWYGTLSRPRWKTVLQKSFLQIFFPPLFCRCCLRGSHRLLALFLLWKRRKYISAVYYWGKKENIYNHTVILAFFWEVMKKSQKILTSKIFIKLKT